MKTIASNSSNGPQETTLTGSARASRKRSWVVPKIVVIVSMRSVPPRGSRWVMRLQIGNR